MDEDETDVLIKNNPAYSTRAMTEIRYIPDELYKTFRKHFYIHESLRCLDSSEFN